MNVLKNTKKTKKFILVIVAIMLFSFAMPKQVKAWGLDIDVKGSLSDLFFWVERGVIKLINNMFCDERHKYEYDSDTVENTAIYISPETIIKGKFALLDPNIFKEISKDEESENPENDKYYDTHDTSGGLLAGTAVSLEGIIEGKSKLREVISGWYYALRNLAIIALLSILVYVGIRMIISTLSQDKAKYKMMLKDWLVALCLVMVMHYIMIAMLNITSEITDAIGTSGRNSTIMQDLITKISTINNNDDGGDDHETLIDGELYTIGDAFALELVLLGVIGYTLIFAVKYLLRMITIVFLILIAPITAITYPIDKLGDGKAQAFNMWFQEFLYEVIIQPFHLLIYIVLIGSATTLAQTNWLYSIMCFAVMIPAEKFIKQMFGFKDKLGSPLGSFAGGAVFSQLMNKAFSGGGGSSSEKNPKIDGKAETDDSIRENKLKPGLPDAGEGSGEPRNYNTDSNDDPGGSNTPGGDNTQSEENTDTPSSEDDYSYSYSYPSESSDDNTNIDDNAGENNSSSSSSSTEDLNYDTNSGNTIDENNNPGENNGYTHSSIDTDTAEKPKDENKPENDNEDEDKDEDKPEDEGVRDEQNEPNTKGIYTPNNTVSKFKNATSALRERRDRTLLAKYGTKNRGLFYRDANGKLKRGAFGKYISKKGARLGKRAIKGATTLLAAGAAGVVGTMFGQGGKAAIAGGAFGAKQGNKFNEKMSSGYESAKGYVADAVYATKDEEQRRKESVAKMMENPKEFEAASRAFSKRNNGKIATTEEINQELRERAKFKETGLKGSQIDDAMDAYKENIPNMGEDKAFEMAYSSAKLADVHSAADFEDPKKVKNMQDRLMRQYAALGVNQDLADENVRQIIQNAAEMKGIKTPAISTPSRKEEYMNNSENIKSANASFRKRQERKGKTGEALKPTKRQQQHELEMGYNLRKSGVKTEDREKFFNDYLMNDEAREEAKESLGIQGENLTDEQEMMIDDELERRFEIKAKLNKVDDDEKRENETDVQYGQRIKAQEKELTTHIKGAERFVKENTGVEKPTNGQVYNEIKHRLQVKDSYHVSDSEIYKIRKSEEEFVKQSKDKDGAKEVIKVQRANAKKEINEAIIRKPTSSAKRTAEQEASRKYVTISQLQRELMATHSSDEIGSKRSMDKFAKKTMKRLDDEGRGFSTPYKKSIIKETINGSRDMVGIEEKYKFGNEDE